MNSYNKELFDLIEASPTPFHAVNYVSGKLSEAGFLPLSEADHWSLTPGQGYYVTRNGASVIAFTVPQGDFTGFMMSAAHLDSPTFKVKENAELPGAYVRLSTERYGGSIAATWLDRPLSVAGRLLVRTEYGAKSVLCDLGDPMTIIPNVAIHQNPSVNEGMNYNAAVDLVPLIGMKGMEKSFKVRAAEASGVEVDDILSTDLYLYLKEAGYEWGDFISAPKLDDLQCAYACMKGFLDAAPGKAMPVLCLFDNEEVGSHTKHGAAGTFLYDVLTRVCEALGMDYRRKVAQSFLLSCDNAHAEHPNHPEHADRAHAVYPNAGIVVKHHASQSYATDAISASLFRLVCEAAGVPIQHFTNRADKRSGGTLGNIANTQVSVPTIDIGLAQFAMHSSFETAGAKDTEYMAKALATFYSKSITLLPEDGYRLD
ncbi:MAG: M18 family aminopeptidase [Clostridia bacterium]|nr:M18 family aminopeptidase [Clostridia bacterium]